MQLMSNVGHHVESPCFSITTAFAWRRLKCTRPSLGSAVRASKSKCKGAPSFAHFAGPACARRCIAWPVLGLSAPCRLPFTSLVYLALQCVVHCESGALRAKSVSCSCRVRQANSQRSFARRACGGKVEALLVLEHRAVPKRAAQPFNQPDCLRQPVISNVRRQ